MRAWLVAAAVLWACAGEAAAQTGRWLRAESESFIVYGDRISPENLHEATQALEDFDTTLRRFTGSTAPPAENKLHVYLVRDTEALRVVWPGMNREIAGFYRAGAEEIAAFLTFTDVGGLRRNQVLFHEYAHHFMLHNFPHAYPRWYIEGWAEYVSTAELTGRTAAVGIPSRGRGSTLGWFGLLPIEQLLAPERMEGRLVRAFWGQFYANAWFMTDFVLNQPERRRGFEDYVRALGEGGDPLESFEPAFGISMAAFEDELEQHARRGRSPRIRVQLPAAAPQVEVRRMLPVADDLLLPLARARGGVFQSDAEEIAVELERYASPHANEPMAQAALARAAVLRGDYARARGLLEGMLAADPEHVEARYLLARAVLEQAREAEGAAVGAAISEARRLLAQNFRIDPNHAPTLWAYANTFAGGPAPMTQTQLDTLSRTLELAPQASGVRLMLARELMRAEHFENAVIVLRPLLHAPHGGASARQARAMFEAAQRREQPPANVGAEDEAADADEESE